MGDIMNKRIIFMGPLYPRDEENRIKDQMRSSISNAPNVFQWNLIDGLTAIHSEGVEIINVLPIGIWPREYKALFLRNREWKSENLSGREIGCINLPFIKQYMRTNGARKVLKRTLNDDNVEIIIYSTYLPFLKAIYDLNIKSKVTLIVTDLPEFYDLKQTSWLKRKLRAINNKLIYKYMSRVDRFIVLTEHMPARLNVENRPWICVEGIATNKANNSCEINNKIGKAILYTGSLNYKFGIKNLIDAFEMLDDPDLELWICGGGEAEEEIREISKLNSQIKFFGFCTLDQVSDFQRRAMILINPRTNEGEYTKYSFPSKTMEYMLTGKPVIMYKLDGIPDEYDKFLFYVEQNSKNEAVNLREIIKKVLLDYDNSVDKAAKGKQFVIENKTGEKQAEKILDFINNN